MRPLLDILSRDQRHALLRMQFACGQLSDPDATVRDRRSAWVTFYRGFRELERVSPPNRGLQTALDGLSAFVGSLVVERGPEAE